MELFKLFGSIAVDNADANKAIDETGEKAESFSSKLGNGIKTAAKWGTAIVAGASTAVAGLAKFAQSSASTADNIDKMSQKSAFPGKHIRNWISFVPKAELPLTVCKWE